MAGDSSIAAAAGEPPKGTPNPWDSAKWNLTKQMAFAKLYGLDVSREWAASAGTTLGGPRPKPKNQPGKQGAPGGRGSKGVAGAGVPGDPGETGWSAVHAIVADGERRVVQVVDWTGGTGEAPVAGDYLGDTGLVGDIADATDIRGAAGDVGSGATPYDVPLYCTDALPSDGSELFEHVSVRNWTLRTDLLPSAGLLKVAVHTVDLSFPVYLNDTLIATLDFVRDAFVQGDGSQRGTFNGTQADTINLIRFDQLRVLAPDTLDDMAAGLVVTLAGSLGAQAPVDTFYRITESGDRRITEAGDPRILELAP